MAHAGGRPTKYNKTICKRVLELFSEGKSVIQVAAELNVCRDTLYTWAKEHSEFSDTLIRGLTKAEAYWEQIAQAGAAAQITVNTGMLSLILKCRYHWTETQEIDLKGDMSITNLTPEERDREIRALLTLADDVQSGQTE
jgi:hypothetical protein